MKTWRIGIAFVALAIAAAPVHAHHRQSPPIGAITTSGDTAIPRVPAPGARIAVVMPDVDGHPMVFRKDWNTSFERLTTQGDNANPTIATNGTIVAWDSDCSLIGCVDPGRQIFLWVNGILTQVTHDPTGTSVNPALTARGSRLGFESRGDLGGTGNATRQVFVRSKDGLITQVSQGAGSSANISLDRTGLNIVFDSTSDPGGADSGIAQIWFQPRGGIPTRLTTGQAASRSPAISHEGRVIAFESRAALTGDGHAMTVSQIFAYEVVTQQLTQITNDAQGCSGASVMRISRDTRVAYVCHGEGFFHLMTANQSYHLPIVGGDTAQAVATLGTHFMMVSTTADLLGTPGSTAAGHQLYALNLFKLAADPIP